jgi:predicted nuclease with RNAse H fold
MRYLDLQNIIAAKALVVHLVVGVIGIATALVFDKGKEAARGRTRGGNVAANEAPVANRKVSTMRT